jgi:hypothetical protein
MGGGKPKRRTALGLGAEVRFTSVRYDSVLPAEDDATSLISQVVELKEVVHLDGI